MDNSERERQQWAQDIEQRQKKPTKTLNTEKLKDDQHRPYLSRMPIAVCLSELSILDK
jgi:hypothetical protein